jgi:DNA-binding response OmpR family regulator
MRILIIEDNPGDQVLLREAFSRTSHKIRLSFSTTVAEAQAILGKESFNLILLDLNLPGKSGKDFLKEFRTDYVYRRIPIIVLTSSSMEKDIAECYTLGASGYLIKPSSYDELEEVIAALCQFWGKEIFSKAA